MILNIFEQSLLFLPLALGIYISYVVLRIPDLTTDGSFTLGAAVYAISVHAGIDPWVAMAAALGSGALMGAITSFLQIQFHLNPLLAGILLVFILNTVTLKLMGRPNLSLFDQPSIFSLFSTKMALLSLLALLFLLSMGFLLNSRLGLMLYALGNNATLLNLCGKSAKVYRTLGLSLSNGLVGCSGALTAQGSGYADINMGTGLILVALGTVILGERLYGFMCQRPPLAEFVRLVFCLLGVVIYFSMVHCLILLGFDPVYLRLMMGLCLLGFLVMTKERGAFA